MGTTRSVCGRFVYVLIVMLSWAGFAGSSHGQDAFKPDEILVKFRAGASDKMSDVAPDYASANAPDVLKRIGANRKIIRAERVFKDFKTHQNMMKALTTRQGKLSATERKLVDRLRRAPRNSNVPALDRIFRVKVALQPGEKIENVLPTFEADPDVEYAELIPLAQTHATPNDPRFAQQWGLHNTGQMYPTRGSAPAPPGTADADIDAPEAWDAGTTGVIVAVLDTGVDYNHRDIAANMWTNTVELNGTSGVDDDGNGFVDDVHGYDFSSYNQSRDSNPMDDNGHGTHCAGIIGARGNNGLDVTGVCWGCRIMAVRVLGTEGTGYIHDAADGLMYAVHNGADVVSCSFGSGRTEMMSEAVGYAVSQGVFISASAGNDANYYQSYPAGFENVLSVGASNSLDELASFSNYGWSVDVLAPGQDILSLRAAGVNKGTIQDEYTTVLSGTSMACPMVSGLAALVLGSHPTYTIDQLTSVLKMSSDPITAAKYAAQGRVNAVQAVAIDYAPPTANLNMAGYRAYEGAVVSGTIAITGTANGPNFSSYELYYGSGWAPSSWTSIYSSSTPVDGILCGSFDTNLLTEGKYTVRLVVRDTHGRHVETHMAIMNNYFDPLCPMSNDILKPGGMIDLKAKIGLNVVSHKIEWGVGYYPQVWHTDGITTHPVDNDSWGTWDTSNITQNGFYSVKYTVRTLDRDFECYVDMFYFETRLMPNFPIRLPYTQFKGMNALNIQAEDINRDGDKELITIQSVDNNEAQTNIYNKLNVYNCRGELLWSKSGMYDWMPMVADFDGDGYMEIAINTGGLIDYPYLTIYRFDGTEYATPTFIPWGGLCRPMLAADVDRDGKKEIISSAPGSGNFFLFNYNGTIRRRFDYPFAYWDDSYRRFPAVGNFDNDADLEIAVISGDDAISVYNHDGTLVPGWPAHLGNSVLGISGSLTVGDVNADGQDEIVAVTEGVSDTRGVFVLNRQGQIMPGWPVLSGETLWRWIGPASLADFDGDGDLEICFTHLYRIHVYHHNGQPAAGWPKETNQYSPIWAPLSIGDINGDFKPDVIVTAGGIQPIVIDGGTVSSSGGVWAWNFDGTPIDLNPMADTNALFMEIAFVGNKPSAVITDMDNDGKVELLVGNTEERAIDSPRTTVEPKNRHSLYAWKLDVPYVESTMQWPMFQRDASFSGKTTAAPLTVWVDYLFGGTELGTLTAPFSTTWRGANKVATGGTVSIFPGHKYESIRIIKPMRLTTTGGGAATIGK